MARSHQLYMTRQIQERSELFLESCASDHMISNQDVFLHYQLERLAIFAANGESIYSEGAGLVYIKHRNHISKFVALHCPDVKDNLLILGRIFHTNVITGLTIKWQAGTLHVEISSNVFSMKGTLEVSKEKLFAWGTRIDPLLLHQCTGHPHQEALKHMFKKQLRVIACKDWLTLKSDRQPFSGTLPPSHALLYVKGMPYITTSPYTPEQKPISERGMRSTVEKGHSLLQTSGAPHKFWGEAVDTLVLL
ncbi:hypothetical protein O181_004536 [Austropuccinia psidii MF-1]|uniref:Retrovirus-related Pol polyprotein from transposon TNT 1-94-like beta-barrel domain-containing protein n=1 Tax=Austropuccinia psidii MF-1 TaxID=1389203 RepID=A0A9Q3BFR1_9BASI|nr:hypothetical protein [Austropuccinia psidii MF-1]